MLPRLIIIVVVLFCGVESANAMYNPSTGRFLNRDPIGMRVGPEVANGRFGAGGGIAASGRYIIRDRVDPAIQYADGLNLYQYVGSNPVNRVDPSGLLTQRTENIGNHFTVQIDELEYDDIPRAGTSLAGRPSVNTELCEDGHKLRLRYRNSSFVIQTRYEDGPKAYAYSANDLEHERIHQGQYLEYLKEVARFADGWVDSGCMCPKKARCYSEAIKLYVDARLHLAFGAALLWDCKDYPDMSLCTLSQEETARADFQAVLAKLDECKALMK
jgi:hypothetical protein